MKDYGEIRRRYLQGESQRQIAKDLHISRNTVTKYCNGGAVPWERKTPERNAAVLSKEVVDFICRCLEEDASQGLRKQQHTAKRIYDRLVEILRRCTNVDANVPEIEDKVVVQSVDLRLYDVLGSGRAVNTIEH